MPLVRKLSFLCIQMNYTVEDVKNIRLTRTLLQVLLHYLYFVFKGYFAKYKKVYNDITLYDNGIEIKNSFIPYEYIVSFSNQSITLLVDENLKPADSVLKLKLKTVKGGTLVKTIKNNMYYHLKYNAVNLDMLTYKSIKINLTMGPRYNYLWSFEYDLYLVRQICWMGWYSICYKILSSKII